MYIRFTKSVHLHYRTRVFTLSNTHIRPPFRVCFPIYGHDKSDPTAANGLQQCCEQIAIYTRTPTKNHTFAPQIPTFRTTKTYFSHRKYPLLAPQIPTSCNAKTHFSHRKNLSATNWEGRKNVLLKSSL